VGLSLAGGLGTALPPGGRCGENDLVAAYSFVGGGARSTVGGGLHEPERWSLVLSVGFHVPLSDRSHFVLEYVPTVVPLEVAAGNAKDPLPGPPLSRTTTYGAGLDPIAFEMRFGRGPVRPYVAFAGGFRVFDRNVPEPRGTRFNYIGDIELGLAFRLTASRALEIGVELHHVSNGDTGEVNPGLNMLLVNLRLLRLRGQPARDPARKPR
jgi:hypothetical protein